MAPSPPSMWYGCHPGRAVATCPLVQEYTVGHVFWHFMGCRELRPGGRIALGQCQGDILPSLGVSCWSGWQVVGTRPSKLARTTCSRRDTARTSLLGIAPKDSTPRRSGSAALRRDMAAIGLFCQQEEREAACQFDNDDKFGFIGYPREARSQRGGGQRYMGL